jgi:hypothetical protein
MADGDQNQGGQQQAGDGQQQQQQQQSKPWYDGKLDADLLGHVQNAGWKVDDPATLAAEAVKAHREARKFIGVPESQLLRLPTDAKDEAGWNSVWQRLGVPKDPKEYDFSAVKRADGSAIDDQFAETIRQTAATNRVPKDAATAFAQSLVKYQDDQRAAQVAEATAKLNTEKADLAKSWGPNADMNKLAAMQGAKRLGVDAETIAALENVAGYSKVMEMFRKIGAGTSEDTFVDGKSAAPATAASAQARLDELSADKAWRARLFAGDAAAKREHDALIQQITGVAA